MKPQGSTSVFVIDDEHLMETSEVATRMGVSRQFVRDLINYKLLPAMRFKSHQKVIYSSFVRFLKEHEGQDLYVLVDEAKETQKNAASISNMLSLDGLG